MIDLKKVSKEICKRFNISKEQLEDEEIKKFIFKAMQRMLSGEWVQRLNGNCIVEINKLNGTKITTCLNDNEDMNFEVPNNMDIKLTNKCFAHEWGLPCSKYCHEQSNKDGEEGDILHPKFLKIIHSLPPGTEMALGGGMVTTHKDLEELLKFAKARDLLPNITVRAEEFNYNKEKIVNWIKNKLVNGVGVSINPETNYKDLVELAKIYPTIVFHTIAGIWTLEDYNKLADNGIKVLILGYKNFGNGITFSNNEIKENISVLNNNIKDLFNKFKVLSFDNLALTQLDLKSNLDKDIWDNFYQGPDGTSTMYIDAVEMMFGRDSCTAKECRMQLLDYNDIKEVFSEVKKYSKEKI